MRSAAMKLLVPYQIDDTKLVSSNIVETDYPAIVQGQAYPAGQRVVLNHSIYESLTGSVTTWTEPLSPTEWYPVGPTNRWAMFDDSVGTHSIATGTIQVSLQGLGAINDIVLLGVTGTSVTVTLPDTSRTVPVPAPQGSEGSVVLIEGLSSLGGTLQVTVSGSGTVMVGNISIGTFSTVADSVWGTTLGIADFSTKEFDDYGEVIIVERDYASTVNAKLEFPTMDADRIVRLLAAVRSTPVVWVGVPGFISSVVFGYYKDFSLTLSSGHKSTGTVQVEALAFGGN